MRFPFFRNRDSVKNGILISIRRTGDGFHPGLFTGIKTATEIGTAAGAKIYVGRRVLWNVAKIRKYLDEISE